METAWIGLAGVIAGGVLGFVGQELRARFDETRHRERRQLERIAEWQARRISDTNDLVIGRLRWIVAFVAAPDDEFAMASTSLENLRAAHADADPLLVGDDHAALLFDDAEVALARRGRQGGITPELLSLENDALIAVVQALDAQMTRVLRDEAPKELSPAMKTRVTRTHRVSQDAPAE